MALYNQILRPALFRLDAETAHDVAMTGLRTAGRWPHALHALFGPAPVDVRTVCGIPFRNPVGLAAGMDKNAVALPAWAALGFGFVEVGTITAQAQPGNPKPRSFRYPQLRALINRFGFNNDGAEAVSARLERLQDSGRWPAIPVGINIGKSKATPLEDAPADYRFSFERLRRFGDYFVVNVSSPNTPGLRDLQAADSLRPIMATLRDLDETKPIFVKIAPDVSAAQLDALAAMAESAGVSGWVATNTSLDHSVIPAAQDQTGGLSGEPIRAKSLTILRDLRERSPLPIIASGGIMTPESAAERLTAGAALVQIYTGFVYHGPHLIRTIVRGNHE